MYRNDMLVYLLAPQFHKPVLIGSLAVLGLVALRAVAVWREAGQLQPVDDMTCQENHVHTASCNHLAGLPTGETGDATAVDDHGHSHDMSWVFARMLVLVFPIALFALGIPNSGFSKDRLSKMAGTDAALDPETLRKLAKDATVLKDEYASDGSKVRTLQTATGMKLREITPPNGEVKYVVIPDVGTGMSFNELTVPPTTRTSESTMRGGRRYWKAGSDAWATRSSHSFD